MTVRDLPPRAGACVREPRPDGDCTAWRYVALPVRGRSWNRFELESGQQRKRPAEQGAADDDPGGGDAPAQYRIRGASKVDWLDQLGQDRRGSRPRCVLLMHGDKERVADRLTTSVVRLPDEVVITDDDLWMPQGKTSVSEARRSQLVTVR